MRITRAYVLPMLVFVGCVVASAAMVLLKYEWAGWRVASCVLEQRCFCEGVGKGFIRQWSNTYSNLAFVFVGLWLWGLIRQDQAALAASGEEPPNLLLAAPSLSGLYAIVVVALGLMSMFFHASLTFAGQWCDVQAMYLITAFLVLYNLARRFALTPRVFVVLYLVTNVVLGLFQLYVPSWRRFVFGGLLGLILLTAWLYRRHQAHKSEIKTVWLYASGAALAVAFGIWQLDINKIWCDPRSWLQGHAVWHGLCALSAGLIYLYYRSERATS